MTPPVFGVTGWKNSGKTTLVERLVGEFTARGLTVSTVKHAHHAFDIDKPGADSHRHRLAGAREVAIVSGARWALMHEIAPDSEEPTLDAILPRLSPCDLILIEGYKREGHPKIECRRRAAKDGAPIFEGDDSIVAIASDHALDHAGRPVFGLDDIGEIADFIARHLRLGAA